MQTIYIDTLLCVNLFIDYILLLITRKTLHIHTRTKRLIFSSLFGACTSLCALLPFYSVFLSAMEKIISAIIIVLIGFGRSNFRNICIRFITFLGLGMILSSAVLLINNLLRTDKLIIYNDVIYFDISPIALLCTTAIVYISVIIYHKLTSNKFRSEIHKITLSTGSINKLTFESALDTGCNLKEPFSGLPVILTEEELFEPTGICENKLRVIPFSTVSGSDIVLGFKPDKVEIDGKELKKGCYIGICRNKLTGEIKSIMGQDLLEVLG
ncbi:MAG: sigma-E processing peptidase SpoIIGA [Ruminococcus sp.]|nr:sigma-E processing peptidase SpoIIGA [Ruminococcus sp.]